MSITKKSISLIFLILFVDQAIKIYIKLHFALGEHINVFSWFQIYFIENNGMAFGMELIGKLFLTIFRIIAVGALGWYIHLLIKKQVRTGYILTISLVLAGAAGNIIDSLFYGLLFTDSYGHIASFLPESGGYASLFYGKVVDMLYFPIIQNSAGETIFFSPVFNIADSAISVAVIIILLFYRKELNESLETKKDKNVAQAE
ncbi:MAG: lipoprotein signal peptidase [Paludibacter sp.]|nr:lipoprotein signal peptidase [Paludibacter sp.]